MTEHKGPKIGAVLLAAGRSSRLGRPKQLLVFEGKTLLRRAAETLVNSVCDPVVAVLGAEVDSSTEEIQELPIHICINDQWQTGMSSSIQSGLEMLMELEPNIEGVMI